MSDHWPLFDKLETEEEVVDPMQSLVIDDTLPVLDKIHKYIKSDIMLHRLYLVRSLADACRQVGFTVTGNEIIPILERLVQDKESAIRQAVVEQIPDISMFFLQVRDKRRKSKTPESNEQASLDEGEVSYTQILHILIPIVAELTTDRNQMVRMSAADALTQLAALIDHDDLLPYLIPIIKSLAHDSTEEEHRLQAAQLLTALSGTFGKDLSQEVVLPLIAKLAADPVFRVRKAIALNIGEVCKTVGSEITANQLLPTYITLSKDDIWGVRKACAESLVSIGQALDPAIRYQTLIDIFDHLVEDQSRWVKGTAYQTLGPFIATLDSNQVTPKLVRHFTDMERKPVGDSDLPMHCAFNLPAVLLTIGASRWEELSETYFKLTKDNQWRIRKTLSHSLHEVAKILGSQIVETSLLPTFELFLKDLDEVKVGVVQNLGKFLAVLSVPIRQKYLPLLVELQLNSNWRFKKLLAKQVDTLAEIFPLEDVHTTIVPLAIHLCQDQVSTVRKAASKKVGLVLCRLQREGSTMTSEYERQLLSFATHAACHKRQMFITICESLYSQIDEELFVQKFLPKLLKLHQDIVPNVRFMLASILRRFLAAEIFANIPEIQQTLDILRNDKDKDVRYFANTTGKVWKNPSSPQRNAVQKGNQVSSTSIQASTPSDLSQPNNTSEPMQATKEPSHENNDTEQSSLNSSLEVESSSSDEISEEISEETQEADSNPDSSLYEASSPISTTLESQTNQSMDTTLTAVENLDQRNEDTADISETSLTSQTNDSMIIDAPLLSYADGDATLRPSNDEVAVEETHSGASNMYTNDTFPLEAMDTTDSSFSESN